MISQTFTTMLTTTTNVTCTTATGFYLQPIRPAEMLHKIVLDRMKTAEAQWERVRERHVRLIWCAEDERQVREARIRFRRLSRQGMRAFVVENDRWRLIKQFEAQVEDIVFKARHTRSKRLEPHPTEPLTKVFARIKEIPVMKAYAFVS